MYASPEQRAIEIEAGAGRSGLDLQIDLDTSAGRLSSASRAGRCGRLGRGGRDARRAAGAGPAAAVGPAARGRDPPRRSGHRLRDRRHRYADGGVAAGVVRLPAAEPGRVPEARADAPTPASRSTVGSAGEPIAVSGTSANLLGWLMSRVDASAVTAGLSGLHSSRHSDAWASTTSNPAGRRSWHDCPTRHHDQDQCRADGQQRLPAAEPQRCQPADRRGQRR